MTDELPTDVSNTDYGTHTDASQHFPAKSFTEYHVRGKNVHALYLVLLNQIMKKENSYDIVSSFSFENCSVLHSQPVVNNELFGLTYQEVMLENLYETSENDVKVIKDQDIWINREYNEQKNFGVFKRNVAKRVYKLVLSGVMFANNVKELIDIFRYTQRNLKVKAECEDSTIYC